MRFRKQDTLFVLAGFLIGYTVFITSSGHSKRAEDIASQQKVRITSVPEIVSCLKGIKEVKAEIERPEGPDAFVNVEVENTTDIGVIGISMESTKDNEGYSVISSTFGDDEPLAIIKPHGDYTLSIPLANINADVPLQLGSVMYADGTEEGCKSSLDSMHETKLAHESERAWKKANTDPK